jgi:hypothetical protein
MQTLEQLLSGKLKGSKTLKLSCDLYTFPKEIFDLADTLEILDLSGNHLSQLPENFGDLKKLKIAFFSDNYFTVFPEVLSMCPNLTMIGFKSNKISYIPETAFPVNLQWLILTNNSIEELPKSVGNCLQLQKVALAGNKLKELPKELANCKKLELLRISANQISQFPDWLLSLPRLSWLAYSGNPCCKIIQITNELSNVTWNELTLLEQLGEGASGIISKAFWNNNTESKHVAVKVFKGDVTSDGFAEDEMNTCIATGYHKNLVTILGKIQKHPEEKLGLVLELIPPSFKNLAGPPNFDTCTRDTFKSGTIFSLNTIFTIVRSIADASEHLHTKGIMHGDLYAHNTLIDEEANTIFGDFGASTIYDISDKNAFKFERLDVRSFGCLIEDLLNYALDDNANANLKSALINLKEKCMNEQILERPDFTEICEILNSISSTN